MSVWYHRRVQQVPCCEPRVSAVCQCVAAEPVVRPGDVRAAHGNRTDVVYVTRHQPAARAFAAFYPDGALYRVEPHGDMRPDPDAPSSAAMCEWAIVLDIVHPRVVFAHRTPQSWLRMMQEVQP